jgi:hypothetical protein
MTPKAAASTEVWNAATQTRSYLIMAAYQCDNCERLVLAETVLESYPGPSGKEIWDAIDAVLA